MGQNQAQWEEHSASPWALEEGHATHSRDRPFWKDLWVLRGPDKTEYFTPGNQAAM